MTKRKPKIWLIVVTIILLAIFGCIVFSFFAVDSAESPNGLNGWMNYIADNALLKNIAMPGSHDSGTTGMLWPGETQHKYTKEQLNCGTRYLDIRVAELDENTGRIYHGPLKGQALEKVLQSVKDFLSENPSETVILDFQHFDTDNAKISAVAELNKYIPSNMRLHNTTEMPDNQFIDQLTLASCRGKAIIVWGSNDDNIQNDDFFLRNNDEGDRANNCCLHSYYVTELNTMSSGKYTQTALPQYLDWYTERGKNTGLFVLQGQLTDKLLVIGPKMREAEHARNMNNYVKDARTNGLANKINIVLRDYVTANKCANIIALNCYKAGIVKEGKLSGFIKLLNNNLTESYKIEN